jgi:hypothetical protein
VSQTPRDKSICGGEIPRGQAGENTAGVWCDLEVLMSQLLGELLINRGFITHSQLTSALEGQNQYGGKLGTNLVEMGLLSEEILAHALSDQLLRPVANSDQVASIAPEILERIPLELVEKFRVIPFAEEGKVLRVCMSDPSNLAQIDDLSFRLGMRIEAYVITELALNYALERYYGITQELRFLRVQPNVVHGDSVMARDVLPLSHGVAVRQEALPVQVQAPGLSLEEPCGSPLAERISEARSRDDLMACIEEYCHDHIGVAVIFEFAANKVVPIGGSQLPESLWDLSRYSVPLLHGSLLSEVITSAEIMFCENPEEPELANICEAIGVQQKNIAVFPVHNGERMTFLVMGVGLESLGFRESFNEHKKFFEQVSDGLQIVSLRQRILNR